MTFQDYSPLIDTGFLIALALIVWAAYRELRGRTTQDISHKH